MQPKVFHRKTGFARSTRASVIRHALQLIRPTGSFAPRSAAASRNAGKIPPARRGNLFVSSKTSQLQNAGTKISLPFFGKLWFSPAIPARMRGVSRSSRTLGRRSGGRDDVAGRAASLRTTKPCGPGLPTLRPSRAKQRLRAAMGARKPGPQGERVISRKAIAQGRPDCSVPTCGSFPVLFLRTGAAGVADTRPSLRTLLSGGTDVSQDSDASAPRE